jgi:hypothetical protein
VSVCLSISKSQGCIVYGHSSSQKTITDAAYVCLQYPKTGILLCHEIPECLDRTCITKSDIENRMLENMGCMHTNWVCRDWDWVLMLRSVSKA